MQQNKKTCMVLYLEDVYEELAMEVDIYCNLPNNPISNQPSFHVSYVRFT